MIIFISIFATQINLKPMLGRNLTSNLIAFFENFVINKP